jgi:hypothetical protein
MRTRPVPGFEFDTHLVEASLGLVRTVLLGLELALRPGHHVA